MPSLGQQSKNQEMNKVYDQQPRRIQHLPQSGRAPIGSPMIERWLDEGNEKKSVNTDNRDNHQKGAAGMAKYLQDWGTTWDGLTKDAKDQKKT